MSKPTKKKAPPKVDLFARVAGILEKARTGVVRAVNSHMVLAYWLIGREIVLELQGGKGRAEYGEQVLIDLAAKLTGRYGEGFSRTNLKNFRTFYLVYADRLNQKGHTVCDLLDDPEPLSAIQYTMGTKSVSSSIQRPSGAELLALSGIRYTPSSDSLTGFSPQLSWSHYRTLMRVDKKEAREFYEREAIAGGWDKRTLERQIHSYYFERLLKSQHPEKMLASGQELPRTEPHVEILKNPYVLEFLGLSDVAALHETKLEETILSYLQSFLLELGEGFAFVARQKRLRFGDDDRYVDLVFYHIQMKFYLLIDLKLGELSHADGRADFQPATNEVRFV